MTEWIKNNPTICDIQQMQFRSKDTNRLKWKIKNIFHDNSNKKRANIYQIKNHFKQKLLHKIIKILYIDKSVNSWWRYNNYKHIVPNNWAPKYMEVEKGETDGSTVLVWAFNAPHSLMEQLNRGSIKKETGDLNIINPGDLKDMQKNSPNNR